jgi:hypothetical protein
MPVWKYAKNKQVTVEEIDKVLTSIICFKCGKDLHSDECPFSKLRTELQNLKQSVYENTK